MNYCLSLNKGIKRVVEVQTEEIVYVLDTPTGLTLSTSGARVTAQWNAVNGATSYIIKYREYIANGVSSWEEATVTNKTKLSFDCTGPDGATYQVRVKAVSSSGDSAYSDIVTITPTFVESVTFSYNTETVSVGTTITATPTPANATVTFKWFLDNVTINGATTNTLVVINDYVGHQISCTTIGTGDYYGYPEAMVTVFAS